MANLFSYLLAILSGLLAIPSAALCLEIGAGLLRPKISVLPNLGARWRVAVLVPAHNESAGIAATLSDIKAQLREGDDLLVIADNCNDDTAAVALASGAEVVERNDSEQIGKGYALDWGLRHLESNPPEIVVMIDADCRLADGAIDQLASTCLNTRRPVQALYLMTRADGSQINQPDCRICMAGKELGTAARPSRSQSALSAYGHRHGLSVACHSRSRSRDWMDRGRSKARARFDRRRVSTGILSFCSRVEPIRRDSTRS